MTAADDAEERGLAIIHIGPPAKPDEWCLSFYFKRSGEARWRTASTAFSMPADATPEERDRLAIEKMGEIARKLALSAEARRSGSDE